MKEFLKQNCQSLYNIGICKGHWKARQVKDSSTLGTPARALTDLSSQSPSTSTPMPGTCSPPRNGKENDRVAENIRADLSYTVLDEVCGGVVHDEEVSTELALVVAGKNQSRLEYYNQL
ncbi:hypothetical protein J6590_004894 [Homalodisca vitripennis]|nr:hypothetical protein J6590_004894 [Homalodisca vitripennis]